MASRKIGHPTARAELREKLLAWYRQNRRDLPWRKVSDPYSIWVSEVMLQQTTVTAVLPYWSRFLEAFPSVCELARAPIDDVLRLWSGLGYYSRARRLHEAARFVCTNLDGRIPSTARELEDLPGVGRYTAAAIASIAYEEPAAAIDGNVHRVLARLAGVGGRVDKNPGRKRIEILAAGLVHGDHPGDLNQALMELGALVCRPRSPTCRKCPWSGSCAGETSGRPEDFPAAIPRRSTVQLVRGAGLIARSGRLLLRRIPPGEHNAGLFEFPAVTMYRGSRGSRMSKNGVTARWRKRFERAFELEHGHAVTAGEVVATTGHSITHHRISVYLLEVEAGRWRPRRATWSWLPKSSAESAAVTAATRKLLSRLG